MAALGFGLGLEFACDDGLAEPVVFGCEMKDVLAVGTGF